jgi:hypothetical protein
VSYDPAQGWTARLAVDGRTLLHDSVRLVLHRPAGDSHTETIVRIDGGAAQAYRFAEATWPEVDGQEFHGLLIPRPVWSAIGELAAPSGEARAQLAEVRDALQVERARVDRLLGAREGA